MTPPCARRSPAILLFLFAILLTTSAFAQSTQTQTPPPAQPTQPPPDEPKSMIDRLKEPDQAGGLHLTEHFAVVFGGIKQGSGIAVGPAVSNKFEDGSFIQLKGVYSIKNFKLVQLRYDSRRFWNARAIVISRLRWQDAPRLSLYLLGPDTPDAKTEFGERKTEGSTRIVVNRTPHVTLSGGFGIERYSTRSVEPPLVEGQPQPLELTVLPGVGVRPTYAHTFGAASYDTRLSPDYSRDGRFFEALLRDFHDVSDGQDSFRRFEGTAQQLVPTDSEKKGVIDVSFRVWLSQSATDTSVPFFMMPTLGGGDLLKAFPSYRFRDRNAMLFKGEYRWAVHKMIDVAGIYEAGKVAPRVKDLSFDDVENSVALGVRAHTEKAGLFRADVAHGRDGWGFRVGFSAGGS